MENSLDAGFRIQLRIVDVLNAFRHQWKIHAASFWNNPSRKLVLNAFRHQWKIHNVISENLCKCGMCSTPFGINGKFTLTVWLSRVIVRECSTPFGINGKFTVTAMVRFTVRPRAQRLSASMENSLVLREGTRHKSLVLNAFRHQWKIHQSRSARLDCYGLGAQRLSASMENSPVLNAACVPPPWCSTPFGINGKFTQYNYRF